MTHRPAARPAFSRRTALRRSVFAAGVSIALVGCGTVGDTVRGLPRPAPRKRADNEDQPLLDAARADQEKVLGTATTTLAAHASLKDVLDLVIAHHRTHVQALGGGASDAPSPSATSSPTAPIPTNPAAALRALLTVERDAALARASDTTRAVSGEFAQVLAAVSASQAQHVVVLGSAVARIGKSRA